MNNTIPRIAVFDFDGTLVAKDTFIGLLKIGFKSEPWRLLFLLILWPIFIIKVIFGLDRSLPKSVFLWCITAFRGKKQNIHFLTQSLQEPYERLWFQEGLKTLDDLYKENVQIVIATASGQIWVRSLLRKKFAHSNLIIGTRLKFFAGGVVLSSKNCRDMEKLKRLQKQLPKNFIWESSWSDHIADLPILKEAKTPYIICPKQKHVLIFKKALGENVKIFYWNTK